MRFKESLKTSDSQKPVILAQGLNKMYPFLEGFLKDQGFRVLKEKELESLKGSEEITHAFYLLSFSEEAIPEWKRVERKFEYSMTALGIGVPHRWMQRFFSYGVKVFISAETFEPLEKQNPGFENSSLVSLIDKLKMLQGIYRPGHGLECHDMGEMICWPIFQGVVPNFFYKGRFLDLLVNKLHEQGEPPLHVERCANALIDFLSKNASGDKITWKQPIEIGFTLSKNRVYLSAFSCLSVDPQKKISGFFQEESLLGPASSRLHQLLEEGVSIYNKIHPARGLELILSVPRFHHWSKLRAMTKDEHFCGDFWFFDTSQKNSNQLSHFSDSQSEMIEAEEVRFLPANIRENSEEGDLQEEYDEKLFKKEKDEEAFTRIESEPMPFEDDTQVLQDTSEDEEEAWFISGKEEEPSEQSSFVEGGSESKVDPEYHFQNGAEKSKNDWFVSSESQSSAKDKSGFRFPGFQDEDFLFDDAEEPMMFSDPDESSGFFNQDNTDQGLSDVYGSLNSSSESEGGLDNEIMERLDAQEKENLSLKLKLDEMDEKNFNLIEERQVLQEKIEDLKRDLKEEEADESNAETERLRLKEKLEEKGGLLEDLKGKVKELHTAFQEQKNNFKEKEGILNQELLQKKREIQVLANEKKRLESDFDRVGSQDSQQSEKLENLKERYDKLLNKKEQQIQDMQQKLVEAQNKFREKEGDLREEIRDKKTRINELEKSAGEASKSNGDSANLKKLEDDKRRLEKEIEKMKNRFRRKAEALERSMSKMGFLEKQKTELYEKNRKMEHEVKEVQGLRRQLDDMKSKNKELVQRLQAQSRGGRNGEEDSAMKLKLNQTNKILDSTKAELEKTKRAFEKTRREAVKLKSDSAHYKAENDQLRKQLERVKKGSHKKAS